MTAKKSTKTARSAITKATSARIQKLLAKKKLTYREIAAKCKVSPGSVSRLSKKFGLTPSTRA
jgi:transcriptional regulator with XRE-family HTH domain